MKTKNKEKEKKRREKKREKSIYFSWKTSVFRDWVPFLVLYWSNKTKNVGTKEKEKKYKKKVQIKEGKEKRKNNRGFNVRTKVTEKEKEKINPIQIKKEQEKRKKKRGLKVRKVKGKRKGKIKKNSPSAHCAKSPRGPGA